MGLLESTRSHARATRGKHWIFPCVGEWTFYKEPVSAMMSGDQEKLRLTCRTRCKGNETHQSTDVPDLSADSWSKNLVTIWQRKHTELLGRRLMWESLSFLSFPCLLRSFQYFSHLLLFCLLLQSIQILSSMHLSVSTSYSALPANPSSSWPSSHIYLLSFLLKHVFL